MIELTITAIASFLLYLILMDKLNGYEQVKEQAAIAQAKQQEVEARLQERRRRLAFDRPEACNGCIEYHGIVYGGDRLICAMHPYGVDGESCPDWH